MAQRERERERDVAILAQAILAQDSKAKNRDSSLCSSLPPSFRRIAPGEHRLVCALPREGSVRGHSRERSRT